MSITFESTVPLHGAVDIPLLGFGVYKVAPGAEVAAINAMGRADRVGPDPGNFDF